MVGIIETLNRIVWGLPTLVLILGTGLYFTIRSGFYQITAFPKACRMFWQKLKPRQDNSKGVSPYQALCTALAATVGTGNIVGVAGAMTLGGPGAIFWMWISALFGMVIKCAEATLAVRYRIRNQSGELVGGPMYMIEKGLGRSWKWLGSLYAFFGIVAAFGVGNATQINAVLGGIKTAANAFQISWNPVAGYVVAAILAVLIGLMLSGGAKRIGKITEALVPFGAVFYILLGIGVLVCRYKLIPNALSAIVFGAFSPRAFTGGIVGSLFLACKTGAARGVFTNEAGMGTASIAHGAAEVSHPVEQGLMGIMEVFLDTLVICTVTALVILCSGISIPYGIDSGAWLTSAAFSAVYGNWVSIAIALAMAFFALATVVGWGFYGLRCAQYLLGDNIWKPFVVMQVLTVLLGAVLETGTVWILAEIVNGLMAIPNLIALLCLSPEFLKLIHEYKIGKIIAFGGTNENFNQCESVRTFSYAEIPSAGGSSPKTRKDHLPSEYRPA